MNRHGNIKLLDNAKIDALESVIAAMIHSQKPVIIFGAGIVGEVIYNVCREHGLNVDCFCDSNTNKTLTKFCDTRVISPESLNSYYPEANIIISAADIHDVIILLANLSYDKWLAGSVFLEDVSVGDQLYSVPSVFVEYAVTTCIQSQNGYLEPERFFLRSVDIIITEKCSLRCADCSNLMQYYENPRNCDTQELLQSVALFCQCADEINEFRVIGGEPFMNKEIHLVVRQLANEPIVNNIVIYTNGTICPTKQQIPLLKDPKVLVLITDYGDLSRNLEKLIVLLREHHIRYYVTKVGGWTDCATILQHNRTPKALREIFSTCCAKNTFTLSGSKFYRCPFSANLDRLKPGLINNDNHVTISKDIDISAIKKNLKDYILRQSPLQICDYCNGRPFGAPEITPAIQLKKRRQIGPATAVKHQALKNETP